MRREKEEAGEKQEEAEEEEEAWMIFTSSLSIFNISAVNNTIGNFLVRILFCFAFPKIIELNGVVFWGETNNLAQTYTSIMHEKLKFKWHTESKTFFW